MAVPLTGLSKVTIDTTIRVKIGLIPKNVNSDPQIGLTDGTTYNEFILADKFDYGRSGPCYLKHAVQKNTLVPTNTPPFSQVTVTFQPYRKYGTCHTAQNGGYVNVGTFESQLDIYKDLKLTVARNTAGETYDFYYFYVEIIN